MLYFRLGFVCFVSGIVALRAWAGSAKIQDIPVNLGPITALVGATVYLPGGYAAPNTTVVLRNGKVDAVGNAISVPESAWVINARGKVVTAGFIDAFSRLGMQEIGAESGTSELDVAPTAAQPAYQVIDGYNPLSIHIPIARQQGVTSIVVTPPDTLLSGQSAAFDLAGKSLSECLIRAPLAMHSNLTEESIQASVGTKPVALLQLRELFSDARQFAEKPQAFDDNRVRKLALRRLDLEAMVPFIKGQMPWVVTVRRGIDIERVLAFAGTQKVKVILADAGDSWLVAGALASKQIPVMVRVLDNLPNNFDRLTADSRLAGYLDRAGVPVIIASFDSLRVGALRQFAGNAIRYGMTYSSAMRSVTEVPADTFALKGYGRIEPGAIANIVLWSGDPFEVSTLAERVFIRGEEITTPTRQQLLLERYRHVPVSNISGSH